MPTSPVERAHTSDRAFRSDDIVTGPSPWNRTPIGAASPLRFAVIGDRTGLARPGVFEQGMRQLSWLRPDFVLSVGDLIEGYTEDRDKIARQWLELETAIAGGGLPFVYTQGNHDVDNAETLDAWRERRGPGYFSFLYKGALFLILNTEDTPTPMSPKTARRYYELVEIMQRDPEAAEQEAAARAAANAGEYRDLDVVNFGDRQLGFVRDTLARHPRVRWTFVALHKPAWKRADPDFARIQDMLKDRPHTVFAGHTHYFTHEIVGGRDYINMGTTGGIRTAPGPGNMDHVMIVTLTRSGPVYANIRLDGLLDVSGASGQARVY